MQSLMQNSKTDLQIDLNQIRIDILKGIRECEVRGLKQTTKWLSELNYALKDYKINYDEFPATFDDGIVSEEKEAYALAKSYFDCQEYDRAAHFLENCNSQKCIFLHKYSQYLSSEKKKIDNATEPGSEKTEYTQALLDLLSFFKANHNNLDGYLLYLEGVVLKKLDLRSQAVASLQAAVTSVPILWCAWVELASLSDKYEALDTLQLPKHWMMNFFTPHTLIELKLPEQALEIYTALVASGFDKSTYITAQMAIAHHDRRDVESSLALFRELYQTDPYRIDNWDVYSHSLFLLEKRMELANLAQRAASIDKYRVETCCVIGNYYSLRGEHQKAVIYFQRALSLDPQYLSAWILMGHEYIELQNANAAIQSYRQATDVNRNDYRAWNGLGQAYEILGLNSYCIYYYSRAAQLKPDDSRMLVSLGEAYEKMDKIANALKCYCKAHSTGDIEGMALFKLAKLYEKSDMPNNAAAAYTTACQDPANAASKDLPSALRYLAQYYFRFSLYDHSAQYAYKCLEHESTKEIGKDILKSISEHRLTARSAQAANSSDDVAAAKPYDKSGAGSIDRDCPVTMDSLPRALYTPQSGVPLDTPQSALTLDTPQSGVSLDTPREGSLNTPHTPGTPLPGPHVTPDNFSTPVFTRKNKYKM